MQYEWKIIKILPVEQVGSNNTEKRTVIIEETRESEYKGWIAFDLWTDKMGMIEDYSEWDVIIAHLNPKVREYNGKWYNSISAWKIEGASSSDDTSFVPEDEWLPFN